MPHLDITTLGALQARLDSQSLAAFRTDKVRALLVFLAVEAARPHRRDVLASMFWADRPDAAARGNLRQALYRLREALGDQGSGSPHLLVTPHEIQFDPGSDYRLDVKEFSVHQAACQAHHPGGLSICASCLGELRSAAALYAGDFLAGFSLPGCPQFEWWLLTKQEAYHRQILETLARLVINAELDGDYSRASEYAQREIELEPWHETAHRSLMRNLALSGRRSEALRHYKTCQQILADELGVEPSENTLRLFQQIRAGDLQNLGGTGRYAGAAPRPPSKIFVPAPLPAVHFAGFTSELAILKRHLESALKGQGKAIFITGGAGRGKTTLVGEFARRAMDAHGDLLVISGGCNTQSGYGDPFLPFRQILRQLTGDLESSQIEGANSEERLLAAFPAFLDGLLESGPDLIGTLLPLDALIKHSRKFEGFNETLQPRVETLLARQGYGVSTYAAENSQAAGRPVEGLSTPGLEQAALFDQVTRVLRRLAHHVPLILALDDLHWADQGTASLLFHLSRNLTDCRILLVGAYRPDELTQEWPGPAVSQTLSEGAISQRHPLRQVINELQAQFGDIKVDLSQSDGRAFVDEYLDRETNALDQTFRETLYQHTGGHALFTTELLRSMQERGDLVKDENGCWITSQKLDWDSLPPRVEAVIAERLDRLPLDSQALLAAASVQGVTFSAEVLAHTLSIGQDEVTGLLSDRISKQHRLVRALGFQRLGDPHQARYVFQHYLYHKYLYQGLDPVERARQHQSVAQVLESMLGAQTGEQSALDTGIVRLAWHFEQAGMSEKAIDYLIEAGKQAYLLSANLEAIAHYKHALDLFDALPWSSKRIQTELDLQLALCAPLRSARGYAAPEFGKAIARACELAQEANDIDRLVPALFLLAGFHNSRADYHKVLELDKEINALGEVADNPLYLNLFTPLVGMAHVLLGNFEQALEYFAYAKESSDLHQQEILISPMAQDMEITCLIFRTWNSWFLGCPDQAQEHSQEAVQRAKKLNHINSLVFVSGWASCVIHSLRRDYYHLKQEAEALLELSLDKGFDLYQALAKIFLGRCQVDRGQVEKGLTNLRQGLIEYEATGHKMMTTLFLIFQAEAFGKIGQVEQGLDILADARTFLQESGECLLEAEIERLKGELILILIRGNQLDGENVAADINQAELCFRRAIQVARRQGSKSLELRAATSLCRLWGQQGKAAEACQRLKEIYSCFCEGFDTPDLREAQMLIEDLAERVSIEQ